MRLAMRKRPKAHRLDRCGKVVLVYRIGNDMISSLAADTIRDAMENFFGTLKTECLYRSRFSNRQELEQIAAEYVCFYNYERINLKNSLTPVEIRSKAV